MNIRHSFFAAAMVTAGWLVLPATVQAAAFTPGASTLVQEKSSLIETVQGRGRAVRGGGAARGAAVRGGGRGRAAVNVNRRTNVNVNRSVNVNRRVYINRPYQGRYWRPGVGWAVGSVVAVGALSAAAAAAYAPPPPNPAYCWYYTDPSYTIGYWAECTQ